MVIANEKENETKMRTRTSLFSPKRKSRCQQTFQRSDLLQELIFDYDNVSFSVLNCASASCNHP
jgi:hypothetical protein